MIPRRCRLSHLLTFLLWAGVWAGLLGGAANPPKVSAAAPPDLAQRPVAGGLNKEDWPQFLGPHGDGKSTETGLDVAAMQANVKAGKPPLSVLWRQPLGTGYGAPTIARGRLFQFDRLRNNARIQCLNAETGKELWSYKYPTEYEDNYGYNNGPRCSVVIDDDRVYAYGAEGMLICLATETGKKLWEVDTAEKYGVVQNFFGVGSTPVVFEDLLLVMVGGSGEEGIQFNSSQLNLVEGYGSGIVAFDKKTGKQKYAVTNELASYASLKLAKVGNRDWCLAFCRGGLVGLEPASGNVVFEFPWRAKILESVNASMPVVDQGEVLISETYGPGSALLDLKSIPAGAQEAKPAVVWKDKERVRENKALQTHWNTPVVVDGFVYGSSGRHTGNAELRCVDWKTGKVVWSEPGLTRGSLTYIDGHFLCLGEYGQLSLLKVNSEKYEPIVEDLLGTELGSEVDGTVKLKYPCWAAPVIARGLLYVRGDDELVCLELVKGR